MNEEALNDAYGLFKDTGYNGSIDDFKTLINTNEEALNDAHNLFINTGYNGSISDFSELLGVKKKDESTSTSTDTELVSELQMEAGTSVTSQTRQIVKTIDSRKLNDGNTSLKPFNESNERLKCLDKIREAKTNLLEVGSKYNLN